jgi:hypothetical protein
MMQPGRVFFKASTSFWRNSPGKPETAAIGGFLPQNWPRTSGLLFAALQRIGAVKRAC